MLPKYLSAVYRPLLNDSNLVNDYIAKSARLLTQHIKAVERGKTKGFQPADNGRRRMIRFLK